MNGVEFHRITGAQVGVYEYWVALARSPIYIVLNVAVGGTYPKDPNSSTGKFALP